MTEPSTGAGGAAVGITAGDVVWVRTHPLSIDADGDVWTTDGAGGVEVTQGPALPDHPALPAVAAWLAEHRADVLTDLADAAVFCLDEGGSIEHDDPAYQMRLIAAGRALIAALSTDGGA